MLRGEDFEVEIDGEITNVGFYTTRVVKAASPEEAEMKAVEMIKGDKYLTSSMNRDSEKRPMIYLEQISVAPFWKKLGGSGYTFWPTENE